MVVGVMGCVVQAAHSSTATLNCWKPGRVVVEDAKGTVSETFIRDGMPIHCHMLIMNRHSTLFYLCRLLSC